MVAVPGWLQDIINPLGHAEAEQIEKNPALVKDLETALNPLAGPEADLARDATSGWQLSATGLSGWFMRGLKLLFGGILMIIGIAKLTGADNQVVRLARAVPGAAAL